MGGFLGIFYKFYWDTVQDHVVKFIVLTLNVKQAVEFNHLHPISLCNLSYIIVAKIILSRLKSILPQMISPNKDAFIEGRWIVENNVLAQELIHQANMV